MLTEKDWDEYFFFDGPCPPLVDVEPVPYPAHYKKIEVKTANKVYKVVVRVK